MRERPWLSAALIAGMVCVAFLGVWYTVFWGPFTPRVLEIAREQYASGRLFRVPTFSGMPFLEKPPLVFDLLAAGFCIAGGPSVIAARIVNGLMMIVWLAASMMAARRAAGDSAAILTGCLLSVTGVFYGLADRVSVDAGLAATLTVAIFFLWRATSAPGGSIRRGPWLLGLAAGGLAFLTKGFFGMFLFLAPLGAYALWTRDRRIVSALLRPSSLLVLIAPMLWWSAVLYADGGTTYLFEAFVNNTMGRFLHVRFNACGIENLPYGDVGSPQVWWFYVARLGSLAGPAVLLLPFATTALLRKDVRACGEKARLSALSLCFAVVPILVLSFSNQKGVHHLGSCSSGFVIVSALWFDQWLRRRDRHEVPTWLSYAATAIAMLAPLAFIAAMLGLPATPPQATAACVIVGLIGLSLAVTALCQGSYRPAVYVFTAGIMAVTIITRAPGGRDGEDLHFLDFPVWLRAELGQQAFGIYGHGDSDLGVFCWVLEREMVPLLRPADVHAYLDTDEPRFCVMREPAAHPYLQGDIPCFVFASGGNGKRLYTVVMNAAAHRARLVPRRSPPFSR